MYPLVMLPLIHNSSTIHQKTLCSPCLRGKLFFLSRDNGTPPSRCLHAAGLTANVLSLSVNCQTIVMPAKKTLNFEKALSELEKLVEEMEQGNLSLEDSLKRFEKGIALTTECQQALQNAELKVKELVENSGKMLEKDFEVSQ
jgi:exodeoxyribonuclease VII small subunit